MKLLLLTVCLFVLTGCSYYHVTVHNGDTQYQMQPLTVYLAQEQGSTNGPIIVFIHGNKCVKALPLR